MSYTWKFVKEVTFPYARMNGAFTLLTEDYIEQYERGLFIEFYNSPIPVVNTSVGEPYGSYFIDSNLIGDYSDRVYSFTVPSGFGGSFYASSFNRSGGAVKSIVLSGMSGLTVLDIVEVKTDFAVILVKEQAPGTKYYLRGIDMNGVSHSTNSLECSSGQLKSWQYYHGLDGVFDNGIKTYRYNTTTKLIEEVSSLSVTKPTGLIWIISNSLNISLPKVWDISEESGFTYLRTIDETIKRTISPSSNITVENFTLSNQSFQLSNKYYQSFPIVSTRLGETWVEDGDYYNKVIDLADWSTASCDYVSYLKARFDGSYGTAYFDNIWYVGPKELYAICVDRLEGENYVYKLWKMNFGGTMSVGKNYQRASKTKAKTSRVSV